MNPFTWQAYVDGSDIAGLVVEGGTITYGRASVFEQPTVPVCVIELISKDAEPRVAALWPEFGLGDHSQVSGFVDQYADVYAGPSSRITLGAPVVIVAQTVSGFTDSYAATYAGDTFTRFTGYVQAIDYTVDRIRLTSVPAPEAWARLEAGGTDSVTTIPAEADTARVARLCAEAGVSITLAGTAGPTVASIPPDTNPSALWQQLEGIARDCGGLLYVTRDGMVTYRTAAGVATAAAVEVTIPTNLVKSDPLAMSLELGLVRNRIIVEYGTADPVTNLRPTVTAEDTASVTRYGLREARYSTMLVDEADAQAYADWLLSCLDGQWMMPNATIMMSKGTPNEVSILAGLEQGNTVTIPTLLPGSPAASYTAPILGYSETLSAKDWELVMHLAPSHAAQPGGTP